MHCLQTVFHAAKIGLFALVALVECAVFHGELAQLSIIIVTFSDDPALFVIAFFDGHLDTELHDLRFEAELFEKLTGQERDSVIEHYFLFAAWAVEVAKSDLCSCPLVRQHHQRAISMEYMTACHTYTRLFSQLACVTDAS